MLESPHAPLRVVVAAAYPSARAGLRAMLEASDGIEVVGELSPAAQPGEFVPEAADVLVAEIEERRLPAGLEALADDLPAVLIAPGPEAFAGFDAMRPGAYLLRDASAEDLAAAVRAAARGLVVRDPAVARALAEGGRNAGAPPEFDVTLTPRERAVLELVAEGLPNKAIALRLGISDHTVKFHIGAILGKLGAASRTEAVTIAARAGLLPL